MTTLVAERMSASLEGSELERFLGPAAVLVPVPRSSISQPGQLWVPKRVADALVRNGLAAEVQCVLRRAHSVRKSATAAAEERPKVRDHLSSFSIEGRIDAGTDLVLIDDIVTRGATLMAAATILQNAFPEARVRAFAVMRAISDPGAFAAIRAPVVGTISLAESGDCFRRP
jgi:predicted amidophosphoribosyltransferase